MIRGRLIDLRTKRPDMTRRALLLCFAVSISAGWALAMPAKDRALVVTYYYLPG